MAATLITPTDELSGLPLPIAPSCEWLPIHRKEIADPHHAFHPKSDSRLQTVAGLALRNSRIQITDRNLHNEGPDSYHSFFAGPELPTDETDIFSRCVLACAGVIPESVIDLSTGSPFTRSIKPEEASFLRTPKRNDRFSYRYVYYGYAPIKEFFVEYAVQQKLGHNKERLIEEFLLTQDKTRKNYLGHLLIAKSVEVAADKVHNKYTELRRAQLLHPNMPDSPQTLVKHKLGNRERRTGLIPKWELGLREQYGVAA